MSSCQRRRTAALFPIPANHDFPLAIPDIYDIILVVITNIDFKNRDYII